MSLAANCKVFLYGNIPTREQLDFLDEAVLSQLEDGGTAAPLTGGGAVQPVPSFVQAYGFHKKYLEGISFEKEYAPMFVNRYGKAMSYETYRNRFKKLVRDHLRPYLTASSDPELHNYGQLLQENEIGTHVLRHWFTVQLVLRGEEIGDIEYWRGDTSPESAFLYLQNKGELVKELKETDEQLIDMLLMVGGELHGK